MDTETVADRAWTEDEMTAWCRERDLNQVLLRELRRVRGDLTVALAERDHCRSTLRRLERSIDLLLSRHGG